jgi:uncharacterized protein (DUF924 family)
MTSDARPDPAERIEHVLAYWFGPSPRGGEIDPRIRERWFKKSDATDAEIRSLFENDYRTLLEGNDEAWRSTPEGALAYVIVLDQFGRNMHRDTPKMYAGDRKALRAAEDVIERGLDASLAPAERWFLYMPFMHSEELADQRRCVELFTALGETSPEDFRAQSEGALDYAHQHAVIVERFGRFPHRNAILGRPSTDEELAFLKEPGSSF